MNPGYCGEGAKRHLREWAGFFQQRRKQNLKKINLLLPSNHLGWEVPMEEMQTVPPEATRKANVALSHDEIEKLAYSLWKARGCGDGFDEQDWLEAERRLQGIRL